MAGGLGSWGGVGGDTIGGGGWWPRTREHMMQIYRERDRRVFIYTNTLYMNTDIYIYIYIYIYIHIYIYM